MHPIGTTNRKGRNNALVAATGDPGSPWAIGGPEGGHDALHPELGTMKDFERLVAAGARARASRSRSTSRSSARPTTRGSSEHPEWFNRRPDGTLKYAENPPKRYQDIYNVNFDSDDWRGLWEALRDVVLHWCRRGVRAFRVDNPHTKSVPFWEWLIARGARASSPTTIFFAEAFTRPAMMTTLAKIGFSQSYTYFTWKNTKAELIEFLEQLLGWAAYYRPNFFANTPDILHEYLQHGGRPAFEARLVLAATLSPSYGIYSGYEHFENVPVARGQRGVPRLGEVRGEAARARRAAAAARAAAERDPPRRAGAAALRERPLARDAQRARSSASRRAREVAVVVNLDPFARARGARRRAARTSACRPSSRSTTCSRASATAGGSGRNYVGLAPGQSPRPEAGA